MKQLTGFIDRFNYIEQVLSVIVTFALKRNLKPNAASKQTFVDRLAVLYIILLLFYRLFDVSVLCNFVSCW